MALGINPAIENRPVGKLDAQNRLNPDSYLDEEFRGDYGAGTNLIYKGFARPGAPTSSPVWQIAMLTYDGNNNPTGILWPEAPSGSASNDYVFIWNNRATYTYL